MTVPTIADPRPRLAPNWRDRVILAVVLATGSALSFLAGSSLQQTAAVHTKERTTAATQAVVSALNLESTRTTEAVRSAGLMLESSPRLTREQFNRYMQKMVENQLSVNLMEWQPIVPANKLAEFEAAARTAGLADYRVLQPDASGKGWEPVHGRDEYVPVLFSWPENYRTAGLDMSFDPQRMASKLQSRVIGQPVASGTFEIMKGGMVNSGTMAIAISTAVLGADQTARGYLAAVVDLPTLFREARFLADAAGFDLLVFDLATPKADPIYTWYGDDSDLKPIKSGLRLAKAKDQSATVGVALQTWEVVLHPRPIFHAGVQTNGSRWAIATGIGTTLLIVLGLYQLQSSQRKVEHTKSLASDAQSSLARQTTRLQNVLEATEAGTWELNLATGEADVSERWAAIGGMTVAQWKEAPDKTWRDFCHPDDVPALDAALRGHIAGKTPYFEVEYRHRHTNGHWVWAMTRGKLLSRTSDGAPELFAGTVTEIGARKAAEARILELNATLERRVQERSEQLEAAMQTLRQSQEELSHSEARATLSTLAASVSHELSTPMGNGMMTASTLVDQARDFQKTLDSGALKRSDLARFIAQVGEGNALVLRNLERAVDLLQNFRQVAADQASEQRRRFDLRQVLQEVLNTLAPSLKSKPHQVVLEVAPDIAMDSYPGPLGQVIINLINNAYLHAFEGKEAGVVTIRATIDGEDVHLQVQDDGRGITPDVLNKMFEPFFSTKIGSGGTGLGMSIVKNLVTKLLGGRLAVLSTPGSGTTVDIILARHAPDTAD